MMDANSFTWLAGFGILATCWRQCLGFLNRVRSFFIVRTVMRGDVAKAVTAYCWRHYRRSPFGDRFVQSGSAFVRPLSRMQEVAWEKPPVQPVIFFNRWRPLLLGGMAASGHGTIAELPESSLCTLTTVRGLFNINQIIITALDEYNGRRGSAPSGRYRVTRVRGTGRNRHGDARGPAGYPQGSPIEANSEPDGSSHFLRWTADEIGAAKAVDPLGPLAFPDSLKPAIDEFLRWKGSESWFKSKQIPWRRGWLLFGKPGTGKTSLVRALAQLADLPVWSYDLSGLSNDEMVSNWREMQESAPCVALMEDMDAVFDGRTNRLGEQGGGLTFDCLLNCLSGIETCDGVFTVITTNHVESIDPALGIPGNGVSSRPGRLDRAIEMPDLDANCLTRIALRIVGDWPELIENLVTAHLGYTGAQFTEICVQEALRRYWSKP